MIKPSKAASVIRNRFRDYRIRILVLIAAFGMFAAMLAAVGADDRGDTSAYYRSSENGYTASGVRLVETPVSSAEPQIEPSERLDINTASVYDLAGVLPGIGEKKALAIVEYRRVVGGFKSVDELIEVDGIGEKLLERIRPYCYVSAPSDSDE